MRPHHVTITPRSVTLDGVPLVVHEDGPRVDTLGADLSIVHIPVITRTVTLQGDTHHPDEPTPIYDQLMDDTYGQIVRNLTHNGHPVRVKLRKDTK